MKHLLEYIHAIILIVLCIPICIGIILTASFYWDFDRLEAVEHILNTALKTAFKES